jgi:hypothetical protein
MNLDSRKCLQLPAYLLGIGRQYAEDDAGDVDPRGSFHVHITPDQFEFS